MRSLHAWSCGVAVTAGLFAASGARTAADADPLSFFGEDVQLSDSQRARLDSGEAIAKILPADHHELAVFAAGVTSATPHALVRSIDDVTQLKKSSYVPEAGRFSVPPTETDLIALTLDRSDADAIRDCRPGNCDLKLTADEIAQLQQVIAASGDAWRERLQPEFRRLILARVRRYLREGERGIGPYADGADTDLLRIFSQLLAHSRALVRHAPQLGEYLVNYPTRRPPGIESFLYWSKETFARNPIVSVTHVVIERDGERRPGGAEVLAVSRDVFSTRYVSGALSMTVLLPSARSPSQRYLAYVNHTWVDDVYWLWRPFVEHRVKTEAAKAFAAARDRIEGGD